MKWKLAIPAGAAVLVCGYWAAPYITAHKIKQAAERKDAETLAEYVDFPSVRQSLKEQIKAAAMKEYTKDKELMENPFATLGIALIGVVVDRTIDTAVTPAGVAQLATTGIPKIDLQSGKESNTTASAGGSIIQDSSMSYESLDKFSIRVKDRDGVEGKLVLRREGLFSWRLKDVQIQQDGQGSFFSKGWAPFNEASAKADIAKTSETPAAIAPQPVSEMVEGPTDESPQPVSELSYAKCMDQERGDHMGTDECLSVEKEKQEDRLEAAYERAMTSVSDKEALRVAQEQWVADRDNKCTDESKDWEGGTMYGVVYAECEVKMTTQRASQLEIVHAAASLQP